MKKSLIYALAIAAIAGMTSCSQEIDSPAASADGGKLVTVDVQIPLNDGIARAVPQIPEGYKLRCIMQLLDPQGNPLADSRMVEEVEAGAENVRFSFIAPADGYQGAMFWADYVQTLDTDYLYNTDDLKAITYVGANAAGAFDNPAADAFYGYLLSGNSSLTLQRPFTRITFKCADNSYAAYTTVKVTSMAAPTAFNVVNGNTGAFDTSLASGELTVGDNGEWFSTYLFVGNNSGATLGEDNDIKLTLTGAEPALDLTVEGENVPLTRNYDITALISSTGGDLTDIDVNFPGGMVNPDAPAEIAVGNYVNADGTYSATYDSDKCVGVVFATDDTKAYVVALTNTARVKLFDADNTLTGTAVYDNALFNSGDFTDSCWNGFLTASDGISSPLKTEFDTWVAAHPLTGSNLSAWYCPSPYAMATIAGMLLNDNWTIKEIVEGSGVIPSFPAQDKAFADAYYAAVGAGATFTPSTSAANYFAGAISTTGTAPCIQINESAKSLGAPNGKEGNPYVIRPMLQLTK